jgi:hypothetical protein
VKTPPRPAATKEIERRKTSTVDADDFVQMAVSMFGGQVVEVRPMRETQTQTAVEAETEIED